MINLRQYQELCKIESGTTNLEYYKKIADLIPIDYSNLTDNELDTKVKEWLSKIVTSSKKVNYIKMNNKWYKVDRDLYTLKFSQWIYFDDVMRNVGDNSYDHIHLILAAFLRPCKFYKFKPHKFEIGKTEDISDTILNYLDVTIALELVNFFFHYTVNSTMNTHTEYLGKLEQEIQNDLKDLKIYIKHTDGI